MNPEVLFIHARFDLPDGAIELVESFAMVPVSQIAPEAEADVSVPAVLFEGEWLLLLEETPDGAAQGVFVAPYDRVVLVLDDGEHQHPVHVVEAGVEVEPSGTAFVARTVELTAFEILGVSQPPVCLVTDRTGVRHMVFEDRTFETVGGLDGTTDLWFAPVASPGTITVVPSFNLANPDQSAFMLRYSVGQAALFADMLCEENPQGWLEQFARIARA